MTQYQEYLQTRYVPTTSEDLYGQTINVKGQLHSLKVIRQRENGRITHDGAWNIC